MKELLKFEFHKLWKQKSFYICLIVMIALAFIGIVLSKELASHPQLEIALPTLESVLLSCVSTSSFTLIAGIFTALFICTDFDQMTIKNIYSRGFSKGAVYLAKYFVSIIGTIVLFLAMLLATFIAGQMLLNGKEISSQVITLLLGQFAYCLAVISFVFVISILVKKTGVSIALAILGPSLIGTVFSLADSLLKLESFKMNDYWLESFIKDLSIASVSSSRMTICILFSIIYLVMFTGIGYIFHNKQEN